MEICWTRPSYLIKTTTLKGTLYKNATIIDWQVFNNRSECHASTIKYLKKIKKIDNKEKDVKVDLILFNHGCGDMFTCEDKPESVSPGVVQDDFEKGNMLREKRLLYLQSIVPYKSNVKHIKVLSAQFHGLTLTIYGSKMTEVGDIIYMVNIKFTSFISWFSVTAKVVFKGEGTIIKVDTNAKVSLIPWCLKWGTI